MPAPIASFDSRWPLDLSSRSGLEAQIAALADDIAYLSHDIDDGLRAGLFGTADLADAPLAGPQARAIERRYGTLETGRFIGELVRTLIGALANDLLAETRRRLTAAGPVSAADLRSAGRATAAFSREMEREVVALKQFLFVRMYRHPRVMTSMNKAKEVVGDLFQALSGDPGLLPADWTANCGAAGDAVTAGIVRDYIAGMTDSFALQEYQRIFHRDVDL